MDISYIGEFVALAGSLNFSATAKELNISQPALSNHIRALETELGVRLFERSKRSVALSKEGRILLADSRNLLELFDDMHRFSAKNLADNYIFTVGGWLENPLVMSQLATTTRQFYDVTGVQLKMMSVHGLYPSIVNDLSSDKLDFLAAHSNSFDSFDGPPLNHTPFCRDNFAIVVSTGNPLADRREVEMADLSGLTFIHLAAPGFGAGWRQVLAACEEAGFAPKERPVFLENANESSMLQLQDNEVFVFSLAGLANGLFFSTRPDMVVVPVRGAYFSVDLFFRRESLHPTIAQFADFLEGRLGEKAALQKMARTENSDFRSFDA